MAISAMVNWRASYIRGALPMRLAVILGLRPPLVTAAAGGGEACLGVFLDESGFVFGHQGANMPKTRLPWAVVVSTMPLVNDCTPTPRLSRVVTMSIRSRRFRPSRSIFQMIRVSPVRRHAPSADATSTASQHPNHSEWRLVTRSLTTGQVAHWILVAGHGSEGARRGAGPRLVEFVDPGTVA